MLLHLQMFIHNYLFIIHSIYLFIIYSVIIYIYGTD